MADNVALYIPSKARVDISEVRLLARTTEVTLHEATADEDSRITVLWPGVTLTIRFMPAEQVEAHLRGLEGYVRASCAEADPEVFARIARVEQVLGVIVVPAFDDDGKCETVVRGIAELHGALILRDNALYDASGARLASP